MLSLSPDFPEKTTPCLVGVSGGRDSMALLHLLHSAGDTELIVCHLNHQLRTEESDADETFVRESSEALGLTFHSERCAVKKIAAERNSSIELAARNARYNFFRRCSESFQTPHLVLAHHADDQAETILHNLFRGSDGPRGMQLRSEHNGLIIHRPLLRTRRSAINAFIEEKAITFREDSTNAKAIATRNRLRNEALPLLAEILQRDPVPPLITLAERESERLSCLEGFLDPQGRLFLPKIAELPSFFQRQIIHTFLTLQGIPNLTRALIIDCQTLGTNHNIHKINLPGGHFFRRKEQRLFVENPTEKSFPAPDNLS